MSRSPRRAPAAESKRFFLRGLAVLLPSVLTLWLIVYAYRFVEGFIAEPVNSWVKVGLYQATTRSETLQSLFAPNEEQVSSTLVQRQRNDPAATRLAVQAKLTQKNISDWWAARWWTNLIGLAVAVLGVYTAGRLLGGFLGRGVVARVERLLTSIPIIRVVYPSVKQVVDFVISDERQIQFSRVVAIEYPRKGIWSMGLVTNDLANPIAPESEDAVTVFLPSSPTPFTGYTLAVPRKDVRELPITIDQAIRFFVSGGVLVPELGTARPGSGVRGPVSPATLPPHATRIDAPHAERLTEEKRTAPIGPV